MRSRYCLNLSAYKQSKKEAKARIHNTENYCFVRQIHVTDRLMLQSPRQGGNNSKNSWQQAKHAGISSELHRL